MGARCAQGSEWLDGVDGMGPHGSEWLDGVEGKGPHGGKVCTRE